MLQHFIRSLFFLVFIYAFMNFLAMNKTLNMHRYACAITFDVRRLKCTEIAIIVQLHSIFSTLNPDCKESFCNEWLGDGDACVFDYISDIQYERSAKPPIASYLATECATINHDTNVSAAHLSCWRKLNANQTSCI